MFRRLATTVAIASAVAVAVAAPAFAQDPPGNNGTVKIDDQPLDDIPNNDPHVGCEVRVDFYGFDEGDLNASVTFELQAPTAKDRTLTVVSGDLNPFIGEDAAGGGTDLDASETYVLAFTGAPHPQQGYHVKLTVHAEGSQGADTKHKVFWVESCPPEEPPGNGNGNGNGEQPPGNGEKPAGDGKPGEEPTPVTIPTSVPAGIDNGNGSAGMAGLMVIAAGLIAGLAVLIRNRVFNA
jgi:hypothetical protein